MFKKILLKNFLQIIVKAIDSLKFSLLHIFYGRFLPTKLFEHEYYNLNIITGNVICFYNTSIKYLKIKILKEDIKFPFVCETTNYS